MGRRADAADHRPVPFSHEEALSGIRNNTIAPGIFGAPMLLTMPQKVQDALAPGVPFPSRLSTSADCAERVKHIIENDMLNGKVIEPDGVIALALN